jgi:hypothetical protein
MSTPRLSARILDRLQQHLVKHPEVGSWFQPKPGATPAPVAWQMTITNNTPLDLRPGQFYGVEVDYSVPVIAPEKSVTATIYMSWAPPCGFYMTFTNLQDENDWAGVIGNIIAPGQVQIVQVINSLDIVNYISDDLRTDVLRST